MQPGLASGLLQVPAWPRKQVGGCGRAMLILSIRLGQQTGTGQAIGSWGQLMGQAVECLASSLPPGLLAPCPFRKRPLSRAEFPLWVCFILFCLSGSWGGPCFDPALPGGVWQLLDISARMSKTPLAVMPGACELSEDLNICHVSVGFQV